MDDWFDRDRRKRRRDLFDIFDEIFREINRMFQDMFKEGFNEESNIRGFSIYMGPEGIDIRDLSGKPISRKPIIWSDESGYRREEDIKVDYDVIKEGDKYVYYIDLRIGRPSELRVYKERDRIVISYNGRSITIPLARDVAKYEIEDYEYKNGVLKIILGKKRGIFRF